MREMTVLHTQRGTFPNGERLTEAAQICRHKRAHTHTHISKTGLLYPYQQRTCGPVQLVASECVPKYVGVCVSVFLGILLGEHELGQKTDVLHFPLVS